MDIHDRLMKLPTTGVTILEVLADDPERKASIIQELVEACLKKIRDGSTNLKILEVFRMILCYNYQTLINSEYDGFSIDCQKSFYIDVQKFFLECGGISHGVEFSLLYDILTLHLVLHHSDKNFVRLFEDFNNAQEDHLKSLNKLGDLHMKKYECFVDAYNLRSRLYKREDIDTTFLSECALNLIESWMKQENPEWRLLSSLLPKLVLMFGTKKIVILVMSQVLKNHNDLGKTLAALCVNADVCFPTKGKEIDSLLCENWVRGDFWTILHQGLVSKVYQQRKQALYLVKRSLECIESYETEIISILDTWKESLVPFLHIMIPSNECPTVLARRNFFLVLESLEEKQKHLVMPALTHLPSLVDAYSTRKSGGYNFHVIWLRCIYTRILQHDNNSIKICGLWETLRAPPDVFDEDFMDFLAESLNNTLLYEYNVHVEKQPEIVTRLEEFFIDSEDASLPLINTFFKAISRVSWCPVAIYWILRAMVGVTEHRTILHNAWTDEELKCCKELIEKNLLKHCKILRSNSQSLMEQVFFKYIKPSPEALSIEHVIEPLYLIRKSLDLERFAKLLPAVIKPSEAELYVAQTCAALMTEESMESFAIKILFLAASGLIFNKKNCHAEKALRQLFENLVSAKLRPYADTDFMFKIVELMALLTNRIFHTHGNITKIIHLVSLFTEDYLQFVERNFEKTGLSHFDKHATVWGPVLQHIHQLKNFDLKHRVKTFSDKCLGIIIEPHEYLKNQWLYALEVVRLDRSINVYRKFEKKNSYIECVLRHFNNEILGNTKARGTEINVDSRRTFLSDCCKNVALLLVQYTGTTPQDLWPENVHWLEELLHLVETGNEEVIGPVATTLGQLLETCPALIAQDIQIVNSIIFSSEQLLFQLNKTEVFFDAVKKLTRFMVKHEYLKLDGSMKIVTGWIDRLMEEGKNVLSLKNIFITEMVQSSEEVAIHFRKHFISCLLHGEVLRPDQRIEQMAMLHCTSALNTPKNINTEIRAQSVMALLVMLENSKEAESEFRKNVLSDILSILDKNKNKRYFDNSHLHRLKHRAMQTLLIMEPYLNDRERNTLRIAICDLLIMESNQPSVRWMHEWLLVRIYAKNSGRLNMLMWEFFDVAAEKRPGSIVSMASVVFHVSRLHTDTDRFMLITEAMNHLLPNCMSQQFNVRLYSQVIFMEMSKLLPNDQELPGQHDLNREIFKSNAIRASVEASLRRGKSMENCLKIMADFYFTVFHPNKDLTLEIIYHQLPRLTGLSFDEFIEPELFRGNYQKYLIPKFSLDNDRRTVWQTAKPVIKSRRVTGELDEDFDSSVKVGLSDIQKKIIPWKSMSPFSDELSEITKNKLSRGTMVNDDTGIIVVGSLIDRPPNLGGLARTCEIFGAKELVIGSLRYVEHREFQTLSVSAEKWITITEVKPHLLKNYLLEQRSRGWKLVGAEQTANSTSLLEMNFDKKTILVLGNEKDGIPANLIPILDTCVEIPQNGVVRSLNVHVTGAICMWQYMKQHVFTQSR